MALTTTVGPLVPLDWTSFGNAQNINFQRVQEGYDGVDTTTSTNEGVLKKIRTLLRKYSLLIRLSDVNSLLHRYDRSTINFLLTSPNNTMFDRTSSFFDVLKKNDPCFFDEEPKTGLCFEIGQPQQKCQRKPTMQSMANPAVKFDCR